MSTSPVTVTTAPAILDGLGFTVSTAHVEPVWTLPINSHNDVQVWELVDGEFVAMHRAIRGQFASAAKVLSNPTAEQLVALIAQARA